VVVSPSGATRVGGRASFDRAVVSIPDIPCSSPYVRNVDQTMYGTIRSGHPHVPLTGHVEMSSSIDTEPRTQPFEPHIRDVSEHVPPG